jgi:glycosyltransferase involved in cell wall biosynthesis
MRPHIHFHSDCTFFGGCENMLANFFNDKEMTEKYEISFGFRFTEEYYKGFKNRVQNNIKEMPLPLFDINFLFKKKHSRLKTFILKIISHPLRYIFIFINTFILFRIFKNIDILHINNGGYPAAYSCMSAVFAARLRGIKNIIYVVNNIVFSYSTIDRILDYPLDRIVAKSVKFFITGSKYASSPLKNVLKLKDEQIITIHNGINTRKVTEDKKQLSKRLNINFENKIIFGVIALLEKRKGHIYLLKAFESFIKNIKNNTEIPLLLIEGTGPEYGALKNYVDKNKLNEYIYFIGDEKNIFNFLANIDIMILPSIEREDFPNVIIEAMSLKKPVISTSISGIPEQIDNMQTGILVKPKNVEELKEALLKFYNNKDLISKFGENALTKFNKCFTKNIAIENYKKLYDNILKGN